MNGKFKVFFVQKKTDTFKFDIDKIKKVFMIIL